MINIKNYNTIVTKMKYIFRNKNRLLFWMNEHFAYILQKNPEFEQEFH